jgi:hypothetical protein
MMSEGDERTRDAGDINQKRTFKISKSKLMLKNILNTSEDGDYKLPVIDYSLFKSAEHENKNNNDCLCCETESIPTPITSHSLEETSSSSNSTSFENVISSDITAETVDPILTNCVNLCQNWCCFKVFYQNRRIPLNHRRVTCCLSCATSLGIFRKKF